MFKRSLVASSLSAQGGSACQHVIRQAVAVARLVGVPAPVHVRQVESPDGAQHAARRKEFADRAEAADLDPNMSSPRGKK
jgi:hypothetical protein